MANLDYSVFKSVFYPSSPDKEGKPLSETLRLNRSFRYSLAPNTKFRECTFVVFDLETTGLDSSHDRIIEIGAIKFKNFKPIDQLSSLVHTDLPLSPKIQKLTGITPNMLVDKPKVATLLTQFLEFIKGSILVAHNADFDLSFIKAECKRQLITLSWPTLCSLKLARALLPGLERKNLDTLANHYSLKFEARHRSIGDAKVTLSVLEKLLEKEGESLLTWNDLKNFTTS